MANKKTNKMYGLLQNSDKVNVMPINLLITYYNLNTVEYQVFIWVYIQYFR